MSCCGASSWSSIEQFGSSGGPVAYADQFQPPFGGFADERVGGADGGCGCTGCSLDRSERSSEGIRRARSAGEITESVSDMTAEIWSTYSAEEQNSWLAANHLTRSALETRIGWQRYLDGGSGSESGSGEGDEEVDPNRMTRATWATMSTPERNTWLREMGRTQSERNRLISASVRSGFDGVVAVLRSRRDVEIAQIEATRDVEIARIRGRDSAERDILRDDSPDTGHGGGNSGGGGGGGGGGGSGNTSSTAVIVLGALALAMFASKS